MSGTYKDMLIRRAEFSDKLALLVHEYPDCIGPQIDPVTEKICYHERDESCNCALPKQAMLTRFVLITEWSDLSEGVGGNGDWSHSVHSPGMTRSMVKGILFTHLHD